MGERNKEKGNEPDALYTYGTESGAMGVVKDEGNLVVRIGGQTLVMDYPFTRVTKDLEPGETITIAGVKMRRGDRRGGRIGLENSPTFLEIPAKDGGEPSFIDLSYLKIVARNAGFDSRGKRRPMCGKGERYKASHKY